MERKYVCIDCGKEFIVESRRATHAKRCPVCRKLHRRSYDKQWKINKRLLDPEYAANMQNSYVKKKFLEDPISFYKHRMFIAAKARAKKSNLPFNICEDDIVIPTECPVLGIKLNLKIPNRGDRGDNLRNYDSPSLDKIIPSLGYAEGNIWVISYRANTIKNNCTFEEIQKLYEALLKLEVNS